MQAPFFETINDYISIKEVFLQDDPLCSVDSKNVLSYDEGKTLSCEAAPIVKNARKIEKEIGINPLCWAQGVAYLRTEKNETVKAPILIQEAACIISSETLLINKIGPIILNPYLIQHIGLNPLQKEYSIAEFMELKPVDLQVEETPTFIGIFHPHRYELIRDIEEIQKSNRLSLNLKRLLLIDSEIEEEHFTGKYDSITDIDFDQTQVLNKFMAQSILVQGPPGTGKSQLIVNSIGMGIQINKTVLLSSEKKSSLDAVYSRLKLLDLHRICLLNYSKNEQKFIVADLKKTWEFFQSSPFQKQPSATHLFPFKSEVEQLTKCCKIDSFFIEYLVKKLDTLNSTPYLSYEMEDMAFEEIIPQIDNISPTMFDSLSRINLNGGPNFDSIEKHIDNAMELIQSLSTIKQIRSINDIDEVVKKLLILNALQSGYYKQYGEVIASKSKKLSTLNALSLKIEKEETVWQNHLKHWKHIPSPSELNFLKELRDEQGFFARLKFKKHWRKWVRTPELDPIKTITGLELYYQFEEKKNTFYFELSQLGIENTMILYTIHQLCEQHSPKDWIWFKSLSHAEIEAFKSSHITVQNLKKIFQEVFCFRGDDVLIEFLTNMKKDKAGLDKQLILAQAIPPSILKVLVSSSSHKEFIHSTYQSVWKKITGLPAFTQRTKREEWIKAALRYEIGNRNQRNQTAKNILRSIQDSFLAYHQLINKTGSKLSPETKAFRLALKKGKMLLVKEFGKKRNFMHIRDLYESEARHWLFVLKPILMMHPQRISTYFPPEPGLFDIAIIDEASQMPFSHSVGTLQRSKRIMIAGDEQQMEPSSFFKTRAENDFSIFHQAKFHLENSSLTHHYRSEDKVLIEFSNRYFYRNTLSCISNVQLNKQNCMNHHFVSNGLYAQGINVLEAKAISKKLPSFLGNDSKIGVIAFSEQQLSQIKSEVFSIVKTKMDELEEQDKLVFKTLDQVQGDEFDILIISFGYGRNHAGDFEMRFGPINQLGGDKRLNVLFSRARKELHFFSSVKLDDFIESKNQGVNLLKKWFAFIEGVNKKESEKYEIEVFSILKNAKSAEDFTHLIQLYKQRGWNIRP